MEEVTLFQILESREKRVQLQEQLRKEYGCAVLSFTMNIPGPVKISPLIIRGFREGIRMLSEALPAMAVLHRDIREEITGCQGLFAIRMEAGKLKSICISLEEETPLGRLFDMDVIAPDGSMLSRPGSRGCIVCGAPGRGCAAGRLHSVVQLQRATNTILLDSFMEKDTYTIVSLATESLLEEVATTPKPGLVDRRNNGSHQDMTYESFLASADALMPYFQAAFRIGQETTSLSPEETFALLRSAGLRAERSMYRATGGVNTHKGIVFSMGILCGALGRLWSPEKHPIPLPALLFTCGKIAAPWEIPTEAEDTPGQRLYREQGIPGIRGEAAKGFPSLETIAIPAFRTALQQGCSREQAGLYTLLHLIARVQDTNLLHRGGREGAAWAATQAQLLLSQEQIPTQEAMEALDDAFIARNLSPGGCADLLAMTYFLDSLARGGYLTM